MSDSFLNKLRALFEEASKTINNAGTVSRETQIKNSKYIKDLISQLATLPIEKLPIDLINELSVK